MVRAWWAVPEPRIVTVLHVVAYGLLVWAGSIALVDQPEVSVAVAGSTLTDVWGALAAGGGLLAAAGCSTGWWWLEREGLRASLGSCVMQLLIVSGGYLGGGALHIHSAYVGVVGVLLLVRMWRIRGRAYAPGRAPDRVAPAGVG